MVTTDTYRARAAAELYEHGVYTPDYIKVADLADAISETGERQKAVQAIRKTAMDSFSPVVFVQGSNEQIVTLGRGSTDDINSDVRDWIEMWDSGEMPSDLK